MPRPLVVLAGLSLLAGCQFPLYVPSAVPTPLVAERGEAQLSGALAPEGLSASLVYAPVAPLSVFALGEAEGIGDGGEYRRVRLEGGGGLGLFAPLGGDWHAEVLGGMTVGSVEAEGTRLVLGGALVPVTEPVLERADLRRAFLQANVGRRFVAGLGGAVGFSGRLERATYRGYVVEQGGRAPSLPTDLAGTFVVPSMFGRFGQGALQGIVTLSYAIPLDELPFDVDGMRTSVGVQLRLDEVLGRPDR